ncbi:CBS domain-containing protein [Chakrabartia godavariana]|nr:CBS domain-containing protein [Chakrabartia godavariana]
MSVKAILQTKGASVFSVTRDMSVAEAVALLAANRIGAVPVLDGDTVLGIFSERDVVYCLARDGAAALDRPVSDVMTAPVMTINSDCAVLSALSLMTRRRIRHLPVVDSGALSGFISIGDLVKHRIEKIEAEAEAMRSYIQSA